MLNRNTESVPRLYRVVRSGARYERSLELLRYSKELRPAGLTKSGVMVGLGEETHDFLLAVFRDLAAVGLARHPVTIGRKSAPLARPFAATASGSPAAPLEVADLEREALTMGFRHVESEAVSCGQSYLCA